MRHTFREYRLIVASINSIVLQILGIIHIGINATRYNENVKYPDNDGNTDDEKTVDNGIR